MATFVDPYPWSVRRVGLDFEWTPPYNSLELSFNLQFHFPELGTHKERVQHALIVTFGGADDDAGAALDSDRSTSTAATTPSPTPPTAELAPAAKTPDETPASSLPTPPPTDLHRSVSAASAPPGLPVQGAGSRRKGRILNLTQDQLDERRRNRGYACEHHRIKKQKCPPRTCPGNGLYQAEQARIRALAQAQAQQAQKAQQVQQAQQAQAQVQAQVQAQAQAQTHTQMQPQSQAQVQAQIQALAHAQGRIPKVESKSPSPPHVLAYSPPFPPAWSPPHYPSDAQWSTAPGSPLQTATGSAATVEPVPARPTAPLGLGMQSYYTPMPVPNSHATPGESLGALNRPQFPVSRPTYPPISKETLLSSSPQAFPNALAFSNTHQSNNSISTLSTDATTLGFPDPSYMQPPLSLAMPPAGQYAPHGLYQPHPMAQPYYTQSPTGEAPPVTYPPHMDYPSYAHPGSFTGSPVHNPGSDLDAMVTGVRGLDLESDGSKPEKGEKRRHRLSTLLDKLRNRNAVPPPPRMLKTNSFPL